MMYRVLSPYGMEDSPEERIRWQKFPLNDLAQDEEEKIRADFEGQLHIIVDWLDENGLLISDLIENGMWKRGNENFIGLLSQLAETLSATYDQPNGDLTFGNGVTAAAAYPFVAVTSAAEAPASPTLVSVFTDIGNAIRAKEGAAEAIPVTEMAGRILAIKTGADVSGVTAAEADVREGKKFVDSGGMLKTGTMPAGKEILIVRLVSDTPLAFEVHNERFGVREGVGPFKATEPKYLPDRCPLEEFALSMTIKCAGGWNEMAEEDWIRIRHSLAYSEEYGDGMLTVRLSMEE